MPGKTGIERIVRRRRFLQALPAVGTTAVTGCLDVSSGGSRQTETSTPAPLEGTIQAAGSSTVYPLTLRIGELFATEHLDVSVSVTPTGTGGGFTNFFCVGKTDINNASRPIDSAERDQCAANGIDYLEFRVATDALTVVVNNDADWIDCVTPAELAAIWETNGADQWSDVRSDWPDESIDLYGPTEDSGTFDYFAEEILGSVDAHRQDYNGTEQDSSIIERIQKSPGGIGYLGFAYYTQNQDSVTALAVDDGDGCVRPSLETAKSGAYSPLSRPLFVYVARESLSDVVVQEFLRYYLEQVETDLVSEIGYVPLTESTARTNRERLEEAVGEAVREVRRTSRDDATP